MLGMWLTCDMWLPEVLYESWHASAIFPSCTHACLRNTSNLSTSIAKADPGSYDYSVVHFIPLKTDIFSSYTSE